MGYEKGGQIDVVRSQDGKPFRAKYEPGRRGFVSRPTVITGEGGREYIIPREGVENPTIRPVIDLLESARVTGNLPTVNLEAALPATMPGRQRGGFAGQGDHTGGTDTSGAIQAYEQLKNLIEESNTVNSELKATITDLKNQLQQPIRADVSLVGRGGFNEAQDRYEAMKRNVYL